MDRYAVTGNPISHSKSPLIHEAFARQSGQQMQYEALLAPIDGFAEVVRRFRAEGGRGMNVTVPFKLEAYELAERRSARAEAAGAVNTLAFDAEGVFGDNTDGTGLVRDLSTHLGCRLRGQRILLLGAGGATRGVLQPLLECAPAMLMIANRSAGRAHELRARFAALAGCTVFAAGGFGDLRNERFDLVINATSASLEGELPPLPPGLYLPNALAYDMVYGRGDTAFMQAARRDGATRVADGLGMLVEQAAESFLLWRGVRPDTRAVLTDLRRRLDAG